MFKMLGILFLSGLIIFKTGISFGLPMVEYNITGPVSGIWTYNYTLKNTGTESIWLWDIYPTVSVSDITKPTNWDFLTNYNSWIEWYSISSSIPAGGFLSGFSYKSSGSPGWIRYEVSSTTGRIISGLTKGAIPEPSSLILLASGMLIGGRLLKRKFCNRAEM